MTIEIRQGITIPKSFTAYRSDTIANGYGSQGITRKESPITYRGDTIANGYDSQGITNTESIITYQVTLSGISTLTILPQPRNACSFISVISSGMTNSVTSLLSR